MYDCAILARAILFVYDYVLHTVSWLFQFAFSALTP